MLNWRVPLHILCLLIGSINREVGWLVVFARCKWGPDGGRCKFVFSYSSITERNEIFANQMIFYGKWKRHQTLSNYVYNLIFLCLHFINTNKYLNSFFNIICNVNDGKIR